jgi:hypothetical protein
MHLLLMLTFRMPNLSVSSTTFQNSWLTLTGAGRPYSSLSHVLYPLPGPIVGAAFETIRPIHHHDGRKAPRSVGRCDRFEISNDGSASSVDPKMIEAPPTTKRSFGNFSHNRYFDGIDSPESRSGTETGSQGAEKAATSPFQTPRSTNIDGFDFDFTAFENTFFENNDGF